MARYDYGLRGYRETARRRPGRLWHLEPSGEDPRDGRGGYGPPGPREYRGEGGGWWPGNRVTARYNMDYVRPDRDRYPMNYQPYGGDTPWRMDDYRGYERPYLTRGGSRTYRGGRRVGWEHPDHAAPFHWVPWSRSRYGGDYEGEW